MSSDESKTVFACLCKQAPIQLSDPILADSLKILEQRIKTDPGFALSLLQKAGIATPDGKLSPAYRCRK